MLKAPLDDLSGLCYMIQSGNINISKLVNIVVFRKAQYLLILKF